VLLAARLLLALSAAGFVPAASGYAAALGGSGQRGRALSMVTNGLNLAIGFFNKFAGRQYEDKRPLQRYVAELKRLLGVTESHLAGRQWIMDDEYTIADVGMLG
jgi:glutathione S-transferase